jgi:ABC-type uncharacterized transport system substrate-binding protein
MRNKRTVGEPADRLPVFAGSWLALAFSLTAILVFQSVSGCRDELPPKPPTTGDGPEHATSRPSTVGVPHQSLAGKRVLLVQSYHPEYAWVETVTQGVKEAMQGSGLALEIMYMDTKRHTDEAWKIDAGNRASRKVEEYKPDIVLTNDDDAQQYFARAYVGKSLPIVFCGVDADPSKYGYPAANVTGVIERPHFKESLVLAQRLRPIRRIAVMSSHDTTSIAALGFMKQEQLDVEVTEWLMPDDFDQWKVAVKRFNSTVDALVIRSYQAVKKPGGLENEDPKDVVGWTVQNATIPTIAFHDFEIKDGILVGVVKSGQEYGRQAMEYGLQILGGTSPGTLPITKTKLGVRMVNRDTARKLGISLTDELTSGVTTVPEK